MSTEPTRIDRIGLLALAAGATIALAWIGLDALHTGSIDANASTLIGVIVGGLIASNKDIIQAIRGYAMSAQLGKVTDQLAASVPPADPQPVVVTNSTANAIPVEPHPPGEPE